MALTLVASRGRVVAADDEVVAGQESVVDLAQSKRRNGNDPNNGRGEKPGPEDICSSRNSQQKGGQQWRSGEGQRHSEIEKCPGPRLGFAFRHRNGEQQPQRRPQQRQSPWSRHSAASPSRETHKEDGG